MRQPAYKDIECRIVGTIDNCDKIMKDSFSIGVYPRIDEERMRYMRDKVGEFMRKGKIMSSVNGNDSNSRPHLAMTILIDIYMH